MTFLGLRRFHRGVELDAQTPVDRAGVCWCVDAAGKGAFYPADELTLTP